MGQISDKLRRIERGFAHWCPACEETHIIFDSWRFDGNLECPTFTPSVKRDANGNAVDLCCHYVLTAGVIHYCGDCTHRLNGQQVPLPPLPDFLRD